MHVRLKVTVGAFYVYLNICLTNVIYKNTNNFFSAIYIQTIPLLFKILDFYVKAMFFFLWALLLYLYLFKMANHENTNILYSSFLLQSIYSNKF